MPGDEIGASEDRDFVATDAKRQRAADVAEAGEVSQRLELAVAVGADDARET